MFVNVIFYLKIKRNIFALIAKNIDILTTIKRQFTLKLGVIITNKKMNFTNQKLFDLQQTAQKLGVSTATLLQWNEYNILKPTITPTGNIGYSQDQIDQFLMIKNVLQKVQEENQQIPVIQKSRLTPQSQDTKSILQKKTVATWLSGLTIVSAILITILLAQQHSTAQGQSNTTMPTALLRVTGSAIDTKNTNTINESFFKSEQDNQTFTTPKLPTPEAKQITLLQAHPMEDFSVSNIAFNNISSFADMSLPSTMKEENSSLDSQGNITGDTEKPTALAAVAGKSSTDFSNQISQETSNNISNQVILFTISALIFLFFVIRKPNESEKTIVRNIIPQGIEKILEVEQKMDGTVALNFLGNTYKISKPELNSDSDQFIERLMELIPGKKELEYDTFNDRDLRLTTPLSRIVTRLGFVGIKRELFFPRTSKHSVLFRKYVTKDDLKAMNLTTEQIIKDLAATI